MVTTVRCMLSAAFLLLAWAASASEPETVTFEATLKYENKPVLLSGELLRPAGEGPFPAVVLMHGCSGLTAPVRHGLRTHARYLGESGFVILVLDSFGPRGNDGGWVCESASRLGAAQGYRVSDAIDAHAFLAGLAFVDADNIFQMGQSNGASVSIHLALRDNPVFRGLIAYYPWCGVFSNLGKRTIVLSAPLQVFGGTADDWTPPAVCAALKPKGADYEVRIYPGAPHSFDLEIEQQRYLGHLVGYDRNATTDSRKRMVAFMRKHVTSEIKQHMPAAETPPRQYLTGAEIRDLLPTGKLKGVNAYGNPYTVTYTANGRMSGVAGKSNEFRDSGKWWVNGDMFCRQYATWLNGTAACFRAVLEDGTISWYDATGALVSSDRFER